MSGDLLQRADWLYQAAATARLERHSVEHSVVTRFSTRLVRLYRGLGDEAGDPFWVDILRRLFAARVNLCALPIPLSHADLLPGDVTAHLRACVDRCLLIYPDRAAALNELVGLLEQLSQLDANPLLGPIEAHVDQRVQAAIVVRSGRFVEPLESYLAVTPMRDVRVLAASRLRHETGLDQLFVVGPANWFPAFVVTAPRARETHLLHYSCVRDDFVPTPVFPQLPGSRPPCLLAINERRPLVVPVEDTVTAVELSNIAVWALSEAKAAIEPSEETVPAHLFLLEEDWAVFLEERSSVLVIDLEAGEGQLHRQQVEEVMPGQFLLLRTERGGDYVSAVADALLGKNALAFRRLQQAWKAHLREIVKISGLFEVAVALLDHGSTCADETNVRNWCSFRSIKTHDRRDFAAIMRLIGWADRESEVWETMEQIDNAHRRAGMRIRQQLLSQVQDADLSVLEYAGRMEFALTEAEGACITAFRVKDRLSGVIGVSENRLGQPFDQEGTQWHE